MVYFMSFSNNLVRVYGWRVVRVCFEIKRALRALCLRAPEIMFEKQLNAPALCERIEMAEIDDSSLELTIILKFFKRFDTYCYRSNCV